MKIVSLNKENQALKQEHYSLINDTKEKEDKLSKELENSVNAHYLKNILMSYLTTADPSVQANL